MAYPTTICWRLRPGEFITDGAGSSLEEIRVYYSFILENATIDPQVAADRWGAELVED
jgi:hypothetical protein